MKKIITMCLTIAMMFTMAFPAFAAADDYVFTILVDDKSEVEAEKGDTISVSVTLTDKTVGEDLDVYIFQDYILYDKTQLKLVESSIKTPNNIVDVSTHSFDDEDLVSEALFINRYSTSSSTIKNGATLVTFDMEVICDEDITLKHHQIEVVDATNTTATKTTGEEAKITVKDNSGSTGGDGGSTGGDGGSTGGTPGGIPGGDIGGLVPPTEEDDGKTDFEDLISETPENGEINISGDEQKDWVFTLYDLECMAEKFQTLVMEEDDVVYSMRAYAVDTEAVWEELSVVDSKLVPVTVEAEELKQNDVDLKYGNIVANPWTFKVIGELDGDTSIMEVFSLYVHRTVEVTKAEAEKITTALIIEGDVQRHVPTNVYEENGKWYACVSCHTNGGTFVFTDFTEQFVDGIGAWYENTTLEMADRRIVYGVGDGIFEGDRAVTRAEFAAILVRALGFSDVGTSDFPDVPETEWFAGAVGRAFELGLINGRDDGSFDPLAPITREEAMAMIARASKVAEFDGVDGETITGFEDVEIISQWALPYVEFNISNNLIKGNDGLIRPGDTITRAETATVVLRLLRESNLVDNRSN